MKLNIENIIDNDFIGTILIKKDENIILEKAIGYANISYCIQNQIDTKFYIASGGKAFVSIAIYSSIVKSYFWNSRLF